MSSVGRAYTLLLLLLSCSLSYSFLITRHLLTIPPSKFSCDLILTKASTCSRHKGNDVTQIRVQSIPRVDRQLPRNSQCTKHRSHLFNSTHTTSNCLHDRIVSHTLSIEPICTRILPGLACRSSAMANQSPPPSPGASGPQRRRSSFAELFNPRSVSSSAASTSPTSSSVPSSVPAPAQKRGMSITTLGLSGNNNTSPFNAFAKQRRASISTSNGSGSPEFRNSFGDDTAVIEEDDRIPVPLNTPASPSLGRRMSFGAQALRDRAGSNIGASGGGRRPSSQYLSKVDENTVPSSGVSAKTSGKSLGLITSFAIAQSPVLFSSSHTQLNTSSPNSTNPSTGEGFNWSEALRDNTKKRSPSFSSSANPFASRVQGRSVSSGAITEPPKEMPKPVVVPLRSQKPDHLGERMLRGDFMMD